MKSNVVQTLRHHSFKLVQMICEMRFLEPHKNWVKRDVLFASAPQV